MHFAKYDMAYLFAYRCVRPTLVFCFFLFLCLHGTNTVPHTLFAQLKTCLPAPLLLNLLVLLFPQFA